MYKILLTASIKSVWAGSGPYCSDTAVLLSLFTHKSASGATNARNRTYNDHAHLFLYSRLRARCCVDVRGGAHIHPSTRIASTTFIYIKETAAASTNWINKSACGVLAQINTLFFLSLSHAPININRIYGIQKRIEHWNAFFVWHALCVRVDKWIWIRYHSPLLKTIRSHLTFGSARCLFFCTALGSLLESEAPINNAIRPVPHGAFYTLCYMRAHIAARAQRDANKY
jgi:hypothetical protein